MMQHEKRLSGETGATFTEPARVILNPRIGGETWSEGFTAPAEAELVGGRREHGSL